MIEQSHMQIHTSLTIHNMRMCLMFITPSTIICLLLILLLCLYLEIEFLVNPRVYIGYL